VRRIIYHSIAAPEMDRAALFRLVYHARVANERRGLTGVLLFADGRFLQVLEGPTWKLIATFETIRRDLRHSNVTVVDERSIPAPLFRRWSMRTFHDCEAAPALAAMRAGANGPLPRVVENAVLDFFITAFVAPPVSPGLPEAGPPSSPRPCSWPSGAAPSP
jgi:hypothetical protein